MSDLVIYMTREKGPIIDAFIGVTDSRSAALALAGEPTPSPVNVRALLDTGARISRVDFSILSTLGIPPTHIGRQISTGAQPKPVNFYPVTVTIPDGTLRPFLFQNLLVSGAELLGPQGIHALLGRDLLSKLAIYYDGANDIVFLYRF